MIQKLHMSLIFSNLVTSNIKLILSNYVQLVCKVRENSRDMQAFFEKSRE